MNCRPGDLAIVVRAAGFGTAGEISKKLLGRIVRVTKLVKPVSGFHCSAAEVWRFEEPVSIVFDGRSFQANGIADECLHPLRDPRDDAQDELLRPLPNEVTA